MDFSTLEFPASFAEEQQPILPYLPSSPHAVNGFLNENIARIEALKIRLLGSVNLEESEKKSLLRELDMLRGAVLELANLQISTTPASDNLPLEELSEKRETDLVLEGILGQSDQIQELLKIIAKVAPSDLTVFLEGETGTGKELLAKTIHLNSQREKFVAVNCGAFPSGLIESELFGHIKGAFTGATSDRRGKFEEADQGTIFLDEIGDLELSAQVKLLRVLEQGELQRVGSDKTFQVDVRVIAATNKNLETMVEQGTFREDLLFRINICPLNVPALRERRDEIEILLEFFFQEMRKGRPSPRLDPELTDFLLNRYRYPGNIRELKNIAKYISVIAGSEAVTLQDLPRRYRMVHTLPEEEESNGDIADMKNIRKDAEKAFLVDLLKKSHGNVERIRQEIGLSRARVYQLLKKFNLKPSHFRS
ncbi:sigma-54 interaction domain-containing protein [Magnetococcales bacterium HHB-1]